MTYCIIRYRVLVPKDNPCAKGDKVTKDVKKIKPSDEFEILVPRAFARMGVTLSAATGMVIFTRTATQRVEQRIEKHEQEALLAAEAATMDQMPVLYTEQPVKGDDALEQKMVENYITMGDVACGAVLGTLTGVTAYVVIRGTRMLEEFYNSLADIFEKKPKDAAAGKNARNGNKKNDNHPSL